MVRDGENPGPGLGAPGLAGLDWLGVGWGPEESPRGGEGRTETHPCQTLVKETAYSLPLPRPTGEGGT